MFGDAGVSTRIAYLSKTVNDLEKMTFSPSSQYRCGHVGRAQVGRGEMPARIGVSEMDVSGSGTREIHGKRVQHSRQHQDQNIATRQPNPLSFSLHLGGRFSCIYFLRPYTYLALKPLTVRYHVQHEAIRARISSTFVKSDLGDPRQPANITTSSRLQQKCITR